MQGWSWSLRSRESGVGSRESGVVRRSWWHDSRLPTPDSLTLFSLSNRHADRADLAATDDAQRCCLTDAVRGEDALQLVRVANRAAAEADDDIADQDPTLLRGS